MRTLASLRPSASADLSAPLVRCTPVSRRRSIAAALIVALAPVLMPAGAWAQDEAATKAARARFQEGVEYYDKGQYENARAAFLQAYALRKHPAVLLNLAQSSLRSGHPLEAVKYFQQFLRESTQITPAQRNDAEKGLTEARGKLGRLEISAPTGSEIMVDGAVVGTAPLSEPIDVEAGTHLLRAKMPDGSTDTKSATPSPGDKLKIVFATPEKAAPAPVPPPAQPTAPPPAAETPPPTGETTAPLTEPPPPESGKKMSYVPAIVGAGVAGAAFAGAVVFYLFKVSAQDSADSVRADIEKNGGTRGTCVSPPPGSKFAAACASLVDNNDKVDTNAMIGNVALGVGIGAAVFAGVWTVVAAVKNGKAETPPPQTTWIRPVPMSFSNGNGLAIEGSF